MGGATRRTSISLPQELLEKGQKIARKRRRNFSNYVADLIASDNGEVEGISARKKAEIDKKLGKKTS